MALASVVRNWTTASLTTVASVQEVMQEINQLMLDAGLVRTADTGQSDLTALPSTVLPATTAGSNFGGLMTLVYEVNDEWSGTDPMYIRFQFYVHRNGQANSPSMLTAIVWLGRATDGASSITGPAISWSTYGTVTSGTSAAYDIRPVGNARSLVYKGEGRVVIALGLGAWTPGTSASGYLDVSFSAVTLAVSRARDESGAVIPSTYYYIMPRSYAGAGGFTSWNTLNTMAAPEESTYRVKAGVIKPSGAYAPDPVCCWFGGSSAQDAASQLQVQPAVMTDAGVLVANDALVEFWSPTGRQGGPLAGTEFTVNDGTTDYTYLSLGAKTVAVDRIGFNLNIGFGLKLGPAV